MAKNKFTQLLFDITKIPSMINDWCEQNLEGDFKIFQSNNKQQDLFCITNNNKEIKIAIYNLNGGAITISPNVGKNQDISMRIAEFIYEEIASKGTKFPFSNCFSIKLSEEDFQTLLDFINEYDDVECINFSKQDNPGQAKYVMYKFKSNKNDTVVLKYFNNTNRLQIQGKPLYLFNEILSFIGSDDGNADEFVNAHIEMCNLNITKEEISDELASFLGLKLFNFLTISQRAFLNSSIVLSKVRIENLEDYSYLMIPACKAYEGLLLKLLANHNIILPSDVHTVGFFFEKPKIGVDYVFKNEYNQKLEQKNVDIFEKMYNFYRNNRHQVMHCSESDLDTTVEANFDTAISKLNYILNSLKSHYYEYCS